MIARFCTITASSADGSEHQRSYHVAHIMHTRAESIVNLSVTYVRVLYSVLLRVSICSVVAVGHWRTLQGQCKTEHARMHQA